MTLGLFWRELYNLAILETDGSQMPQRIARARYAIEHRHNTKLTIGGLAEEEKAQLERAFNALKILECESKVWPAAKRKPAPERSTEIARKAAQAEVTWKGSARR